MKSPFRKLLETLVLALAIVGVAAIISTTCGCIPYSNRQLCVIQERGLYNPVLTLVVSNNSDYYLQGYVTCRDTSQWRNFATRNVDVPPWTTGYFQIGWPFTGNYICELKEWRI